MKTRTAMKTWMTALALTAAGTMLATSAFAQSAAGSSPTSTGTDVKSGTATKSGTAPPASPSASGSTTGSTGSDMKSGAMGSDVKSDAMKSGSSERSARGAGKPEQVKAVQQALKDKGHDAGDVDGRMGPKTQAALRDFQQKEGLKATGRADAETMAKLGVEAKTSSPAASPSGQSPAGASPSDTGAAKPATSTGAKQGK